MNDEAESSRAGRHHPYLEDDEDDEVDCNRHDEVADDPIEEEDEVMVEQRRKERRLDAKRKRIAFLENLLRELDTLVFIELITLYHLDCSFFWFTVRAIIHASLLTPLPDMGLSRQQDEHKPYLAMILFTFGVNFALHLIYPAPSAGEDTRGYLHGGLMIDFIGQEGPTSKWKLASLDIALLLLQTTMVAVHVKRRRLKKKLAKLSSGTETTNINDDDHDDHDEAEAEAEAEITATTPARATAEAAARDQDADAEERGVLRRTDTLSDIGAELDDEDSLLPSSESMGHADALDLLRSGQCVIGEFTLVDTLIQAHQDYNSYRQTRTDAGTGAGTGVPSSAMRQLHAIRMRMGAGGG